MNGSIVCWTLAVVATISLVNEHGSKPVAAAYNSATSAGSGTQRKTPSRWAMSARDYDALYRTAWGEIRGQGLDEKVAVINVIINRWQSGRWGSLYDTVHARKQFSVWNTDDPNYTLVSDPHIHRRPSFRKMAALCDAVLEARKKGIGDNTNGADHYHHLEEPPYWAQGQQNRRIGSTNLYKIFLR